MIFYKNICNLLLNPNKSTKFVSRKTIILENMIDIGVSLPPFLMPIIKLIQKTAEDKVNLGDDNGNPR